MINIPHFLAEASKLLLDRPDQQATLDRVAALGVRHLADWCLVHLANGRGSVRGMAGAHADPEMRPSLERLQASPLDLEAHGGPAVALREGRPWWSTPLRAPEWEALGWGPEAIPIIRELGLAAALAVPIYSRGRTVGALTLVQAENARPGALEWPDRTLLSLAQDLAARCGIAIDSARLRRSQTRRQAATSRQTSRRQQAASRQDDNGTPREVEGAGLIQVRLAEAALKKAVQQQVAVAALGQEALAGADTRPLIDNAIQQIGAILTIGRASTVDLLLLAGGSTIAEELLREAPFTRPASSPPVHEVIRGGEPSAEARQDYRFGRRRRFTQEDSYFLQAVANILAEAIRRNRIEHDLRASRDHLEAILRSVADGIVVQDRSGRPIYSNDAAAKLFGFPSARELTSFPLEDLQSRFSLIDESGNVIPMDRYPGRLALQGVGNAALVARLHLGATGKERWVHIRATATLDVAGKPEFSVTVLTDITEAKRTEDALRFLAEASRSLAGSLDYRQTLKRVARLSVPFLADYCLVDMVHEGGEMSRAVVAHTDPLGELMAKSLRSFAPPGATPSRIREAVGGGMLRLDNDVSESVLAGYAYGEGDVQVFKDLGFRAAMILPLSGRASMAGAVTFVSAGSRRVYGPGDLTLAEELVRRCAIAVENARLYEEAREQRRALQTVLDSMMEGVVAIDGDLRVLRANAFAKRLLIAPNEPLEERPCTELLRLVNEQGETFPNLATKIREAIAMCRPINLEGVWLKLPKARRLPVALTITPQRADNGIATGAVLLVRDMSRYRELDALRESIISLVSHELKTPLFHIKGFANSLLQADVTWDDETRLDFIRTIDREADRLSNLISSILELSHVESGRLPLTLERATPAELVGTAINGARLMLQDHEVTVAVPATLPPVMADVPRMERVLVNLLENAAKYSPPHTRIHLAARASVTEVVFTVTDEGVGIPQDAEERIFEKFVRLRDPRIHQPPGTGLGLTLCRAIVEAHGGRIWVKSDGRSGSAFFFTLPNVPRPTIRHNTRPDSAGAMEVAR